MADNRIVDVIVIGGGPAGSTIATKLAKDGFSVGLFEKEKFPRPHVGESLLPFCYPLFQELGILEELKEKFVRKPGASFVNQNGEHEVNYCFDKVLDGEMNLSFHVRRDEFDQILLENSRRKGVEVYEEQRVVSVDLEGSYCEIVVADADHNKKVYRSRFVVDATGRDCLIAKANKTKEPIEGMDRIAVSAHWHCDSIPSELRSGTVRITYLEGDIRKGWIWCIPVSDSKVSIGVVVNTEYYKTAIGPLKKASDDWIRTYYLQELRSSSSIESIIHSLVIDGELSVNGNYSYRSSEKYGNRFALVGDSAQFIDPIFASGVYIAMKSAFLVYQGIKSLLEEDDMQKLKEAYSVIDDGYLVVQKLIEIYYDPSILNFATIKVNGSESDSDFSKFNHSFALIHLLLAGDFFEKGHVYLPFFESLKDESQLNRWKNLIEFEKHNPMGEVIDCGRSYEQIFG